MQDGDAVVDEAVVDALAQVDAAGGGQGLVVGLVGGGDVVEGGDAGVARGADGLDVGRGEGFGAAGPEGEDEGEAGQAAPLVAEVVFVEAEADVVDEESDVADGEGGVAALEHGGQVGAHGDEFGLDVEPLGAEDAREGYGGT